MAQLGSARALVAQHESRLNPVTSILLSEQLFKMSDKSLILKQSPADCNTVLPVVQLPLHRATIKVGCHAPMLPTLDGLIDAAASVNEFATHIQCLKEHELAPEDRDHIEQKLAAGVARSLQRIGMHQLHLSFKLDKLAVEITEA